MSELVNYSIETDHVVLLAFRDGRRLRVPVGQLSYHLSPPDLEKVRAALKLRRDFIRRHMPKVVIALAAAGGLIALFTFGSKAVASLWLHHSLTPAGPGTGLVRNESLPVPAATPDGQSSAASGPAAAPAATVHTTSTVLSSSVVSKTADNKTLPPVVHVVNQTVTKVTKLLPTPTPSAPPQVAGSQPLPSPTPSPSPSTPPGPSPTPQIPNQGQVLGCQSTDPSCSSDGSTAPTIP